jgi:hypothetical protein
MVDVCVQVTVLYGYDKHRQVLYLQKSKGINIARDDTTLSILIRAFEV